jgi:nucleotide-binding universal stress UspA family protein
MSERVELRRILFASDLSAAARAAWAAARSLGAAFHAELVLYHAIPPLTLRDLPPEIFSRYTEAARAEAEQELGKLSAEAEGEGLKAAIRIDMGRPADQILLAAEEEGVDLIVMGTTGKTGVRRLLLGSVAAEVVRLARCPVLTVGPGGQKEKGPHAV